MLLSAATCAATNPFVAEAVGDGMGDGKANGNGNVFGLRCTREHVLSEIT